MSIIEIVGLFLARLAYLQYHQIATINWDKLQTLSGGVLLQQCDISQIVRKALTK